MRVAPAVGYVHDPMRRSVEEQTVQSNSRVDLDSVESDWRRTDILRWLSQIRRQGQHAREGGSFRVENSRFIHVLRGDPMQALLIHFFEAWQPKDIITALLAVYAAVISTLNFA